MTSGLGRKVLAVVFLLAAGAYFVFVRETEVGTGLTWVDARATPPEETGPETVEVSGEEALARAPGDVEAPEEPVANRRTVAGVVLGVGGEPISGVLVERRHPYLVASSAVSGEGGAFSLALDELHGELAPADGAWMLLGGDRHLLEERVDGYELVVAPRTTWSGTVSDPQGRPLADASARVALPGDVLVHLGIVAPPVEHPTQSGWSDKLGRFRIEAAPRVRGSRLEVSLTGYEIASVPLPEDPATPLEIELAPRK
jgi:hypothetical protein